MTQQDANLLYERILEEDPEGKINVVKEQLSHGSNRWRIALTHKIHNLRLNVQDKDDWPYIKLMWQNL